MKIAYIYYSLFHIIYTTMLPIILKCFLVFFRKWFYKKKKKIVKLIRLILKNNYNIELK